MKITQEMMQKMVKKLQENRIEPAFYDNIEALIQEALTSLQQSNRELGGKLNFFMAGDHVLQTNFQTISPLVVFVSLKQKRKDILAYKQMQKLKRRAKKLFAPISVITDELVAGLLFTELQNYLETKDKLYVSKNVIMVNIVNHIKIKIIVGYNFDGSFEYEYIGKQYKENFLEFLEKMDKKDAQTKHFFDMIRILKSMEIELFNLGYLKDKYFDAYNFVENLVYNVPNELLSDDSFYEAFLKTINYLKNADLTKFVQTDNTPMFEHSKNARYDLIKAKYFIKAILYFYNNFEAIYG